MSRALAPEMIESHLHSGPVLSHYRILEKLGRGEMGVVYRAEDMTLKHRIGSRSVETEAILNVALQVAEGRNTAPATGIIDRDELGFVSDGSVELIPVYVRGQAYLARGDGQLAAIEFQKFIDHRGI